jgi:LysR family glycine cleavage system transcriptional activator
VTAGPAFTAKWLAPRLFAFASAHPDIELRFSASLRLMDFDRDDVDVAIRFGLPREEPGLSSHVLSREWDAPMMTPELARDLPVPPTSRRRRCCIRSDIDFLKPADRLVGMVPRRGPAAALLGGARFSQADHAMDAAASAAGVVLGRITLAERDLREGRLVMPYDIALTTEAVYRVVFPAGAESRPQIRTFIDWLEQEVKGLDPPIRKE